MLMTLPLEKTPLPVSSISFLALAASSVTSIVRLQL